MANLTQSTVEVQAILDNAETVKVDTTGVYIGNNSGGATGINNVGIGGNALNAISALREVVAIGYDAMKNTVLGTGDEGLYNVAVGCRAMRDNTTGHHNTALGWQALQANTVGTGNTAFGEDAMFKNTTGTNNCSIGTHSGLEMTEGSYNTNIGSNSLGAQTIANGNTCVGYKSLLDITTGSNNVAIGTQAGGVTPWGYNPTTDSLCVMIGYQTTTHSGGPFTNSVALGYQAHIRSSNGVWIGNNSVTDAYFGIGTSSNADTKLWFGKFNLSDIPTSASGLSSGDVWADSNVLTIVP